LSLRNCPRCGKVYTQVEGARELCPACIKREEDDYLTVFKFLTTRPSASAQEIADNTQVDIKEIFRFLRENRLRIVKVEADYHCESCGTPIHIGKYCENCQSKLKEEIQKDLDKLKAEKSIRQRTDEKYSIQRESKSGKITRKRTRS